MREEIPAKVNYTCDRCKGGTDGVLRIHTPREFHFCDDYYNVTTNAIRQALDTAPKTAQKPQGSVLTPETASGSQKEEKEAGAPEYPTRKELKHTIRMMDSAIGCLKKALRETSDSLPGESSILRKTISAYNKIQPFAEHRIDLFLDGKDEHGKPRVSGSHYYPYK